MSSSAAHALGFQIAESVVVDIGEGYVMDDYVMKKSLSLRASSGP